MEGHAKPRCPAIDHEPVNMGHLGWLPGDAGLGWGAGVVVGGDLVGEVCGILVDEAEQGGAAGVLPGQAQEVQAGDLRSRRGHVPPHVIDHRAMSIQV